MHLLSLCSLISSYVCFTNRANSFEWRKQVGSLPTDLLKSWQISDKILKAMWWDQALIIYSILCKKLKWKPYDSAKSKNKTIFLACHFQSVALWLWLCIGMSIAMVAIQISTLKIHILSFIIAAHIHLKYITCFAYSKNLNRTIL